MRHTHLNPFKFILFFCVCVWVFVRITHIHILSVAHPNCMWNVIWIKALCDTQLPSTMIEVDWMEMLDGLLMYAYKNQYTCREYGSKRKCIVHKMFIKHPSISFELSFQNRGLCLRCWKESFQSNEYPEREGTDIRDDFFLGNLHSKNSEINYYQTYSFLPLNRFEKRSA